MDWSRIGLRVGTDVQSIAEVARSIERFGDRYVRRLFTEHEIASCQPVASEGAAAGLAARFAAKEATIKVLRPSGRIPPWTSIEVRRDPQGSCDLALTGEAERVATAIGIHRLAVSISHGSGIATATVVALFDAGPQP